MNNNNSEIISIFVNFSISWTFNLNIMNWNPTKLKINSVLLTEGEDELYKIKIPFLTFYLYNNGAQANGDILELETNIPNIINNGSYSVELSKISGNALNGSEKLIIYMTFYYD